MPISFNQVPGLFRVPFTFIEFDNTGAVSGASTMEWKGLMLGQRLASAAIAAGIPTKVFSQDEAAAYFGRGSLIHRMAMAWFKNNKLTPLTVIALDDPEGVAASGTLAFTGTSTSAGAVYAYVGGTRIAVAVPTGTAAADVATAVKNAINAAGDLPCTAEATSGTVTITARWKGLTGNDIDLRLNYYTGEALPAGIACTVTGFANGTLNPSLTAAIAAKGDEQYNVIINPYRDETSLTALKTELDRVDDASIQKDGVAVMALDDTVANLSTFGNAQNTKHFVTLGIYKSPTPAFEIASALAGIIASEGSRDPALPMQTVELVGVLPPAEENRFTTAEANVLLFDGISTCYVTPGKTVAVQRLITMYQKNELGADDPSYLDLTTVLTLSYLRFDTRTLIQRKYPRFKLADDGTRFGDGQKVVTPKVIKAELIARFAQWELMGLVEGADAFRDGLIVERNLTDRNRLDIQMDPDLMNSFLVAGVKIKFVL